tara:strand:- start:97 stop:1065 length:969 start_codon:yes stop_codon:yes gene_type:complete
MVNYKCFRCGYETKFKSSFINHLQRKNICNPLLDDICIESIQKWYNIDVSKNIAQVKPVFEQVKPVFEQVKHNFAKPGKNQEKPTFQKTRTGKNQEKPAFLEKKKIICEFCDKTFTRTYGLTCHLKKCKKKINQEMVIEEKNNEIKELKEIVEKLLIENKAYTNITNNTNNSHNTTNHTTNNIININNYGDEDTKYITSDYILKLLKHKPAKAIPELIKYTHFNKEHPENQNIKITNKKEPYVKVRKNDKWELQDKEDTITDLIDRQQVHLMDEVIEEKIEENCNNSEKVNIERCSELYNNEDKEYMKRLYNESELIIINNS